MISSWLSFSVHALLLLVSLPITWMDEWLKRWCLSIFSRLAFCLRKVYIFRFPLDFWLTCQCHMGLCFYLSFNIASFLHIFCSQILIFPPTCVDLNFLAYNLFICLYNILHIFRSYLKNVASDFGKRERHEFFLLSIGFLSSLPLN